MNTSTPLSTRIQHHAGEDETPRVELKPLLLALVVDAASRLSAHFRECPGFDSEARAQVKALRAGIKDQIEERAPETEKAQREAADLLFLEEAIRLRDKELGDGVPGDSEDHGPLELRWIIGPGHAWLEVPERVCHALGFAEEITSYSYYRDGDEPLVYLEEDCDASLFTRAAEEQDFAYDTTNVRKPGRFCRTLPSWRKTT